MTLSSPVQKTKGVYYSFKVLLRICSPFMEFTLVKIGHKNLEFTGRESVVLFFLFPFFVGAAVTSALFFILEII